MIGPHRGWSRWSDGGHLTLDAVVAFVDGELADGPAQRAAAHVNHCVQCAAEVTAQRQARRRLRGASVPGAPTSLLSSLRAIPDSADLPDAPATLAVDAEGRLVARADESEPPAGTDAEFGVHPAGPAYHGSRRTRRRLAVGLPVVVVSGLAVGAVTLSGPAPVPAPQATPARPVVAPARATTPSFAGAELTARRPDASQDASSPGTH